VTIRIHPVPQGPVDPADYFIHDRRSGERRQGDRRKGERRRVEAGRRLLVADERR
jgi:hypothetical protein